MAGQPQVAQAVVWEQIGRMFVAGEGNLVQLAEQFGVNYETLKGRSEREEWGDRREACKQARLDAPITAVQPLAVRASRAVVDVDLTVAATEYHAAAERLRGLIATALSDAEGAQDQDGREQAERRLDRLLERQRIMLGIPLPGVVRRGEGRVKRLGPV